MTTLSSILPPISLASATGTLPVGNGGTGVTTSTGTGDVVLSNGPSITLTNATGLPLTTGVTGTLPVANGGTGAVTLTGVVKGTGTSALTAGAVSLTTEISGTLPVANGGTGAVTLTANAVLLGNGTSAVQAVAPGTAGNLLTSDGTTWTSAAATSGVQQFTASGSITAGQPVCLRSDGTVEVATGFQQTETLGAAQIRAGADSSGFKLIVPIPGTSNLLVTINNGATRQVLVASVSGATITYNTATTAPVDMLDSANVACTFDPVSGSALFTYSVSGQWRGVVCTVTGTTVAFGTPQVIATQGSFGGQASCYDPLRQQIIIGAGYFPPSYSSTSIDIFRVTISGTTFTAAGQFTVMTGSGLQQSVNLLYNTAVNRIVVVSQSSSVNNAQLVSNSGTAFAFAGGSVALGIEPRTTGVTFDSVNNKYVAVAPDGSNNPVARTFSITASSITVDAAPTFPVLPESRVISSGEARVSYDVKSERVVYIFYTNANNIRYITSTGFGASMVFSAYNTTALLTRMPTLTYLPAQNRTIFYIINDSDGANLRSFLPAADVSNTQNFIGLAAASATTGQTLNVTVTGGRNANQTGLTTGASYFLTSLGALTTAGGVRVGEALSATSMFIEGRLNSAGTPSASTFLRGDGAFAALPASTVTLISSVVINSPVTQILINNIPVTSYSSIIIEAMIRPGSTSGVSFAFLAPGGTSPNANIYAAYSFYQSNNSGSSVAINGNTYMALAPSTVSPGSSEINMILNVQQTNQTTTKRAFTVDGCGDTNASVGYTYRGGGYSNASSWGGIVLEGFGSNFAVGSYYRIYGVS